MYISDNELKNILDELKETRHIILDDNKYISREISKVFSPIRDKITIGYDKRKKVSIIDLDDDVDIYNENNFFIFEF